MRIIIVDDDELELLKSENELTKVFPDDQIFSFSNIKELRTFLECEETKEQGVEYAFLEPGVCNASGLELARNIREMHPECKFIFTSNTDYAREELDFHAIAYSTKPIVATKIVTILRDIGLIGETRHRIFIRTFGNFDVFVNDKVVNINRSKAKELLAYLVDRRGSSVTTAEAFSVLWEDEEYSISAKDKVQHVKKDLRDILKSNGIGEILISNWNELAIDISKVTCDYFDYMDHKYKASEYYGGEYMTQYSWAENTVGMLDDIKYHT